MDEPKSLINEDTPLIVKQFLAMSTGDRRQTILEFEELIKSKKNSFIGDSDVCPLKHTFSEGMYVREISIPKGTILTGKIHKHDHPNFLLKGKVTVVTEHGGIETLEAPLSMISPCGTKRALVCWTDVVWVTIHTNTDNETDLEKIEEFVIAKDYDEYEKFIEGKKNRLPTKGTIFSENSEYADRLFGGGVSLETNDELNDAVISGHSNGTLEN